MFAEIFRNFVNKFFVLIFFRGKWFVIFLNIFFAGNRRKYNEKKHNKNSGFIVNRRKIVAIVTLSLLSKIKKLTQITYQIYVTNSKFLSDACLNLFVEVKFRFSRYNRNLNVSPCHIETYIFLLHFVFIKRGGEWNWPGLWWRKWCTRFQEIFYLKKKNSNFEPRWF